MCQELSSDSLALVCQKFAICQRRNGSNPEKLIPRTPGASFPIECFHVGSLGPALIIIYSLLSWRQKYEKYFFRLSGRDVDKKNLFHCFCFY